MQTYGDTTQAQYNPTTGRNYYVVASSVCGKAKSNVITVCGRPSLVIEAPCCICNGETISLNAIILWPSQNCAQNCTYQWKTGATSQSINVSAPQMATNPPTIHAEKNIVGFKAASAASLEVRKIPIPITSPITIMVMLKRLSLFFDIMK